MKKVISILCMVTIPMLISVSIDYMVNMPDKWNIALYVILYGIISYFLMDEKKERKIVHVKGKIITFSIVSFVSMFILFVLKEKSDLHISEVNRMIIQIAASLFFTISIVILLCTSYAYLKKSRKD